MVAFYHGFNVLISGGIVLGMKIYKYTYNRRFE